MEATEIVYLLCILGGGKVHRPDSNPKEQQQLKVMEGRRLLEEGGGEAQAFLVRQVQAGRRGMELK